MGKNIIAKKSFEFALDIIKLYKILIDNKEFILSKQLLRCGTSIGANVQESVSAQSKKDFINKLCIAEKEARETKYWLLLIKESNLFELDYEIYLSKVEELIKILASIIITSKNNLK